MKQKSLSSITLAAAALTLLLTAAAARPVTASDTILAPAAQAGTIAPAYQPSIILSTTSGRYRGLSRDGALVWRGIPYGAPPVGALRWRAPEDPAVHPGIRPALEEITALQPKGHTVIGSEDSLNLDIYRPDTQETNLPILFYIHGGNNQMGSAAEFDGSLFAAREHAVVVAINHRLDILGFNPLPALHTGNQEEDSGNYALLDIRKALDWTINNAETLGGNPDNITLSGFSAGGRDVLAVLTSPIFKGAFQKAISFSGGFTLTDLEAAQNIYADKLAPLAVADGIKANQEEAARWLKSDSPDVKTYLYSLPSERLIQVFGNGNIRMTGFPHLFADGATLPEGGASTAAFTDVPLLLVAAKDEFTLFSTNDPYFAKAKKESLLFTDPEWRKQIDFTNRYGNALYNYSNTDAVVHTLQGKYHSPVYIADISWGDDAALVGSQFANEWGAHHGIFLPLLTDKPVYTSKLYPEPFIDAGPQALSKALQHYIGQFLRTGNPNGNGQPQWNPVGDKGNRLILTADKEHALIKEIQKQPDEDKILDDLAKDDTVTAEEKETILRRVLNGRWFSQKLDSRFHNRDQWITK